MARDLLAHLDAPSGGRDLLAHLDAPSGGRDLLAGLDTQPKEAPGFGKMMSNAVIRGAKQTGSLLGDVLPAMAGNIVGNNDYANQQMGEAAATQKDIQENYAARYPTLGDVKGPSDYLPFAAETIAEQIPNIATALVPGVGGGMLAARGLAGAARTAAVGKGQLGGAFLGSYALNAPEIFQNIHEETGKMAPGASLLAGSVSAALDAILPAYILKQFTPGMKTGVIEKLLEKSGMQPGIVRSAVAGGATGALTEGPTEATQEAISIAAEKFVGENKDVWGSKEFNRLIESGVRGAVGGGGISGITGAVSGIGDREVKEETPDAKKAAEEEAKIFTGLGKEEQVPPPPDKDFDAKMKSTVDASGNPVFVSPDGTTETAEDTIETPSVSSPELDVLKAKYDERANEIATVGTKNGKKWIDNKNGAQVKLKAEIDALEASLVAQGGIDESTIDQSRTDTGVGESVLPTTSKTEETKGTDTETVGTTSKSTDDTTTGTVTGAGKESSTLTPEANSLLASVDAGGVPAMMTNNLKKIAADNGIKVTAQDTPNSVVDKLRAKAQGQSTLTKGELEKQQLKKEQEDLGLTTEDKIKEEPTASTLDSLTTENGWIERVNKPNAKTGETSTVRVFDKGDNRVVVREGKVAQDTTKLGTYETTDANDDVAFVAVSRDNMTGKVTAGWSDEKGRTLGNVNDITSMLAAGHSIESAVRQNFSDPAGKLPRKLPNKIKEEPTKKVEPQVKVEDKEQERLDAVEAKRLEADKEKRLAEEKALSEKIAMPTTAGALSYINDVGHYGQAAPLTPGKAVIHAGHEQAFDLFDTVDIKHGVEPEIKKRADEFVKTQVEKREALKKEMQAQGKNPNEIKAAVSRIKITADISSPLEFMSEQELVDLYMKHANKTSYTNKGGKTRAVAAKNREEFVAGLPDEIQNHVRRASDAAFRQEVLTTSEKGKKVESGDRARKRRKEELERKAAVEEEAIALSKQMEAEGDVRKAAAPKLSEKEQTTKDIKDIKVAAEKAKEEQKRPVAHEEKEGETVARESVKTTAEEKSKLVRNIETAVNDTKDLLAVLEQLDSKLNDSITGVIARNLLKVLKNLGVNVKVVFGAVEGRNAGKFDPATNTITLAGFEGAYVGKRKLDQLVLHEAMHYLTDHVVANPVAYLKSIVDPIKRREAKAGLVRLAQNHKFARQKFGKKYNIDSQKEFIAEVFSNPSLQRDLANTPVPGAYKKDTLFGLIVKSIAAALGFRTDKDAVLLKTIMEDILHIVSIPSEGLVGEAISYAKTKGKHKTAKPPKRAPPIGRATGLFGDNKGYEQNKNEAPKSKDFFWKYFTSIAPWRELARLYQNHKYPIKTLNDQLSAANLIKRVGPYINNIYEIGVLASGRAKSFFYGHVSKPAEALDRGVREFARDAGLTAEEALGVIHRLLETLHEPERRFVKYLLTVPLSTDKLLGNISPADRRKEMITLLDSKTLTDTQAKSLRKELETIVNAKNAKGKPKYLDPLGSSPRSVKGVKMSLDVDDSAYNVLGLGDETYTTKEVVASRLEAYEKSPHKAQLDKILENLRDLNNVTRELNQHANYWSDYVSNRVAFYDYKNYAPFKGKASFEKNSETDEILEFDPTKMGRELQDPAYATEGRFSVSDNPVLQSLSDATRAAMRAGNVGYTLAIKNSLAASELNPDGQGLITGYVKAHIEYWQRDSDLLKSMKGEKSIFHNNPDGSIDILVIQDEKMLNSIRKTFEAVNPYLNFLNTLTTLMGKGHTRYNYNFAPLNFVRDALTNAWVISADMGPLKSAKFMQLLVAKVMLQGSFRKSAKVMSLFNQSRMAELNAMAKKDPTIRDTIEFIQAGGPTSYIHGISLKSNYTDLKKELGASGIIRTVEQLNKMLDLWTEMFELTSRSAAYSIAKQEYLRKGYTLEEAITKAATFAKELANFELTGTRGGGMGSWFMFFKPSATGAVRAIEAAAPAFRDIANVEAGLPDKIRKNEKALADFKKDYAEKKLNAQITTAGLVGLGMTVYMMAYMLAGDEEGDDSRNPVANDSMEQWMRFGRFHIPKEFFGGEEDFVVQLPWGFGLGAFAAAGAQLAAVIGGRHTLQEALSNVAFQISLDSFVPLPVSRMQPSDDPLGFAVDSIMPSVLRPAIEWLINKNGLGHTIYNASNRTMGDAYTGGDKIPEIYKTASAALVENEFVGMGSVDISPNTLYFLANSYADGMAKIAELAYSFTQLADDKKAFVAKTDIPFLGSFIGSNSDVVTRDYSKVAEKVKELQRKLNNFEKDPEMALKYFTIHPFDKDIVELYNAASGGPLKDLQTAANETRRSTMLTPKEKTLALKDNKQMQSLIKEHLLITFEAYGIKP